MIKTGIGELDGYLLGGIPKGKSLLFYTDPGVEGEKLGLQSIYNNLSCGKNVIYVISSISSDRAKESFQELGWKIDTFGEKLTIIDGYSALIGDQTEKMVMVEDPYDIENYEDVLEGQISVFSNNCMVVFESLSTIIDMCGEKETLKKIASWNEVFQERKITSIYNFIAWPYAGTILNKLRRLFDAVIDVCSISERVIIGQCYCPTKIKWGGTTGDSVPFRVYKPGGVKNYIPKICVIGLHNAGKSSFIESLSMKSLSNKKIESNITVEHGFIKHAGFTVDILGIQGDQDIKSFVETIKEDIIGIFLVIDSTNPSQFIWTKKVLDDIRLDGLPVIIVANKQDVKNAVTTEEIEKKMRIPPDIPVIPTVATEGKNVLSAYEKLIEIITKRNIYGKQ